MHASTDALSTRGRDLRELLYLVVEILMGEVAHRSAELVLLPNLPAHPRPDDTTTGGKKYVVESTAVAIQQAVLLV